MPAPSTSLASLRPDLETFEDLDLEAQQRGFIAYDVLPITEVGKKSGTFGRIPVEELLQNARTERSPGSSYGRGDYTFKDEPFICQEHGWEEPIDDSEREIYAEFFDMEVQAGKRAFDIVLRNAERRVADAVFDVAAFTPTDAAVAWATVATANARADVKAAMKRVYAATGLWPNALILNHLVLEDLKDHDKIIERMKPAGFRDPEPGNINAQQIATALGITRLIVAGSPKNTANKGQAATLGPIWSSDFAMVAFIATDTDFKRPALGRTFHWNADGSMPRGLMESYRDEPKRSDIIRVRHDTGSKIIYPAAGELINLLGP